MNKRRGKEKTQSNLEKRLKTYLAVFVCYKLAALYGHVTLSLSAAPQGSSKIFQSMDQYNRVVGRWDRVRLYAEGG